MNMKQARTCGDCTACCDGWVRITVQGHEASPGSPCPWSTGHGCKHYDQRPQKPCREFDCGWLQANSPLPDWMRPDKSKVIFLPAMRNWHGLPVDVAVPVGKRIPPRALNWLKAFAEQHGRPLIYLQHIVEDGVYADDPEVIAYGPPAFQADIARLKESGERLW